MKNIKNKTTYNGGIILLPLLLLFSFCDESVTLSQKNSWPRAYQDAIVDAQNPEPSEVVHNLTAIRRDNPVLKWKKINNIDHVLMASLKSNGSAYENSIDKLLNTGSDIWVTAAPVLQKMCQNPNFGRDDLDMRLRQILGLTPDSPVAVFIQFWVTPATLFRPAPDNEITDTTAGLNLPENTAPWYRKWFNDLRAGQYFQSRAPRHDAYPWTQLGYTYDWGSDAPNHQGLSEFIIKKNSDVIVDGVYDINTYCGRNASK